MKKILLKPEGIALVDDNDFDYLNQFKWYLLGQIGKAVYARRNGERRSNGNGYHNVLMHREIMGLECTQIVTRQQNGLNRKGANKNSTSNYLGVSFRSDNQKWRAVHGSVHLGSFDTEKEAAIAYDSYVRENFPEHSTTNFKNP